MTKNDVCAYCVLHSDARSHFLFFLFFLTQLMNNAKILLGKNQRYLMNFCLGKMLFESPSWKNKND